MSEKCEYKDIKDYRTAFNCFIQRFLVEKKSIFRLDDNDAILNSDSIEYLVENFINNGCGGKASFIDKIKQQLIIKPKKKPDNDNVRKNAIEVLAHVVWLWRLVPSNGIMSSTVKSVKEVLDLDETVKLNLSSNPFFNKDIKGIAKTGTYYNTNKPFELAFVIRFLELYIDNIDNIDKKIEVELLKKIGNISIITTGDLNTKKKFTSQKDEENKSKTASIFNALLFFFEPDNYEAIVSNDHKEKIIETFKDLIYDNAEIEFEADIDWKIKCIKDNLDKDYNKKDFFYQENIRRLWDIDNIEIAKNIIYYGVPGTGKTYTVLKDVKEQTEDNSKYFKLVQFHPSFGYEEFIDGIKPIKSSTSNDGIQLELINGIFKEMCISAFKELIRSKNDDREAKRFYFIADEINRAELSRVFGELLLCLEDDKRLRFNSDGQLVGEKIKTQNASLWNKEHAVLILDNDNNVQENYDILEDNKNYDFYFGVPENIIFIGTMNDVDKSIESFDLALRRRFIWIKKDTDYTALKNYLKKDNIENDEYVKSCKKLNKKITEIIGKNYCLGHSYFMKIIVIGTQIPDISKTILFNTELKQILEEYLRAVVDENDIDKNIEILKKVFIPEQNK